jgi:hypothetical protein
VLRLLVARGRSMGAGAAQSWSDVRHRSWHGESSVQ